MTQPKSEPWWIREFMKDKKMEPKDRRPWKKRAKLRKKAKP